MQIATDYHSTHEQFLKYPFEERNKIIAYYIHKSEICPTCGTAPWQWDPAQGGSRYAFMAVQDLCKGCETKEITEDNVEKYRGSFITLRPQKG